MEVRCDGYQDCFDRSDEMNCTIIKPRGQSAYSNLECAHPDRLCKLNGNCIRVNQLCDGEQSTNYYYRN